MRKRLVAVLYLLVVVSACGLTGAAWQQQDTRTGTDGIFTIALAGDAIITERLSPYKEPEFLGLVNLIRGVDVAFANFEMLLHDYEGYPNALSGGTWMRADPIMAKELAWAGVDIVARANNHTGDYSPESMRTTSKYLSEAGIVWAGVGENLQQAREAHYLETADGRVALISCASTFTVHSAAGKQRSDMSGRPGLSPLRFATRYIVDQPTVDSMRRILTSLGLPPGQGNQLTFMGNRFAVGPEFKVEQTPDEQDLSEIVHSIRDAKALSDYVVVTIHAHEGGKDRTGPLRSCRFLLMPRLMPARICLWVMVRMCFAGSKSTKASRFSTASVISSFKTKPCCACRRTTTNRSDWDRKTASATSMRSGMTTTRRAFPPTASSGKASSQFHHFGADS